MQKKLFYVLLSAVVSLLFYSGCGNPKMDITQFVTVKISGINGNATASAAFDYPELEEQMLIANPDLDIVSDIINFEKSITLDVKNGDFLTNGDTVMVNISWDAEAAKECELSFYGNSKTFVVSDLKEGVVLNLFNNIELIYDGVSSDGTVKVNVTPSVDVPSVNYSVSPNNDLSNGDTITVTAEVDVDRFENTGYFVNETEKQFIVAGLSEYVSAYSQLNDDCLKQMEQLTTDYINTRLTYDSYVYKRLVYPNDLLIGESLDSIEILNVKPSFSYFFTLKDGIDIDSLWSPANYIFLAYEVFTKDNMNPNGKTTYICLCYNTFILQQDNSIIVDYSEPSVYDSYDTIEELNTALFTLYEGPYYTDDYNYEEIVY